MRTILKRNLCVAVALFAGMSLWTAGGTESAILLWMVNMTDQATDFQDPSVSEVADLTSRPDGYSVNGARVRVMGTDGSEPVYLSLFSDNDGEWQVRGNQPYNTIVGFSSEGEAGPSWADFGAFASTEYSFMIELGHYAFDDNNNLRWTTMAYGETATYEALQRFITKDIVAEPPYTPWTSSYVVPEPSSSLLLLMGGALLALRRRKMKV